MGHGGTLAAIPAARNRLGVRRRRLRQQRGSPCGPPNDDRRATPPIAFRRALTISSIAHSTSEESVSFSLAELPSEGLEGLPTLETLSPSIWIREDPLHSFPEWAESYFGRFDRDQAKELPRFEPVQMAAIDDPIKAWSRSFRRRRRRSESGRRVCRRAGGADDLRSAARGGRDVIEQG